MSDVPATRFLVVRKRWLGGAANALSQSPVPEAPTTATRSRASEWTDHAFDFRASIPLPLGRWYLRIVAGPERRSAERLALEGQTHWLRRLLAYAILVSLAAWGLIILVGLLYALKSALGIDLFEGDSFLHGVLESFRG